MNINSEAEAEARRWLGTPYRHQASVRGEGSDCLGLLRGVWRQLYGHEPQVIPAYAVDPRRNDDPAELQKAADTYLTRVTRPILGGDVLLFRLKRNMPARHCGIAIANHGFIHAQERLGVVEAPLSLSWQRRLSGIYAFPEHEI